MIPTSGQEIAERDVSTGQENVEDSQLFFIDTAGTGEKPAASAARTTQDEPKREVPAWEDSDDERLTVSLISAARHKKLRIAKDEDVVSGTEYAKRLRQQFLRLYPLPEWAQVADEKEKEAEAEIIRSVSGFA